MRATKAETEAIRWDERLRLANLLEQNAGNIVGFATGPHQVLDTIVFLLRLPGSRKESER